MKKIFIMAVACFASLASFAQTMPLVRTHVQQGDIEGIVQYGLGVFKGIPYAQPPVGNLRWKAPVPAGPWKGVYVADTWQARPMQPVDPNNPSETQRVSEDCLYLNIMTPAKKADEKLPVLVWIHGGGFITGSALSPNGTNLAKQGVVFVSIEYRTGSLGFLSIPELTKESPTHTSGNYGLMDQILGLKWVKNNIAAFGGDPDKVTICGESAGGIAVSMLCASPQAKGLFRGAICESGGSFCPVDSVRIDNNGICDQKGAEAFGLAYMKRMGAKSLDELRKMDAAHLVNDPNSSGVGGFWPCVDGYVITDDQYKLYEKGEFNDVDVLVGTNSDEGTMFVRPTSVADYQQMVNKTYGKFGKKVLKAYPAANDSLTYYAQSDIFRETAFAWPTYAWANLQKKNGKGKVYMYYFDIMSPFCWGGPKTVARGAGHAMEMSYTFNVPMGGSPINDNRPAQEKKISDQISAYWVNFVKNGNPNGTGLLEWPEYDQNKPTVMYFNNDFKVINVPNKDKLDLMEDFYKWKRSTWVYRK